MGRSVATAERLAVMIWDNYILDKDMAAVCDFPAILTMVDLAARVTVFAPVEDLTSRTQARAVYTEWVPRHGIPVALMADAASNLNSELMRAVWDVLGVHGTEMSASGSEQHQPVVERAHRTLDNTLNAAFNKGEMRNGKDCTFWMKTAEVKINQLDEYGNITPFEMPTGQMARTVVDVVGGNHTEAITVSNLTDLDEEFVHDVQATTQELLENANAGRDERARRNAMHRDVVSQQRSCEHNDMHTSSHSCSSLSFSV